MSFLNVGDENERLIVRTNLCPSVATARISESFSWKRTPIIAGRNSSVLTAKDVLPMRLRSISASMAISFSPLNCGTVGNSSLDSPVREYSPFSVTILILLFSVSMVNTTCTSGSARIVSTILFAGMAMTPSSMPFTVSATAIEISRSVAVILRTFFEISKRRFSRIGSVDLVGTTPIVFERAF